MFIVELIATLFEYFIIVSGTILSIWWTLFGLLAFLNGILSLFGVEVLEKWLDLLNPFRGDTDDSYGG